MNKRGALMDENGIIILIMVIMFGVIGVQLINYSVSTVTNPTQINGESISLVNDTAVALAHQDITTFYSLTTNALTKKQVNETNTFVNNTPKALSHSPLVSVINIRNVSVSLTEDADYTVNLTGSTVKLINMRYNNTALNVTYTWTAPGGTQLNDTEQFNLDETLGTITLIDNSYNGSASATYVYQPDTVSSNPILSIVLSFVGIVFALWIFKYVSEATGGN